MGIWIWIQDYWKTLINALPVFPVTKLETWKMKTTYNICVEGNEQCFDCALVAFYK